MADCLYTNEGLIDTIVVDLNSLIKDVIDGEYVQMCCHVTGIAQKLMNLRNTIHDDLKNREQTIETLKEELRNAGHTVVDMTPQKFVSDFMEKDGADDGNN